MDAAVALNLVSTIAIVLGLFFAGVQVRQAQRDRTRDAQMVLVNSFNTPAFMHSMRLVIDIPDGLSRTEVEAHLRGDETDLYYWLGTMEGLGLLVFHRSVSIDLVDFAFAGPIIASWHKLEAYCRARRDELQRESMHEWFQWLAERLEEYEAHEGREAAQIKYRDWQP